jgi:hypothetical protein
MRSIRKRGEECLREADAALKTVKTNREEAQKVYRSMKAYKLLTDYYEAKVLAAIAALIYSFGGGPEYRTEADRLADGAVERYTVAINYIHEAIDNKTGAMRGRWLDGKSYTLPELIDREKEERKQLARLFQWPAKDGGAADKRTTTTGPRGGTFAPEKPGK